MDISGKTALVLGGAGLVGRAICRALIAEGVETLIVGDLNEAGARAALIDVEKEAGQAGTELIPVWGNVFVRDSLSQLNPAELQITKERRELLLADALLEMSDDTYRSSLLVQLITGTSEMALGKKPHLIIDAINTATALAYGGLYQIIERVMNKRAKNDGEGLLDEIDPLLASSAVPMLVRHVQLTSRAMIEAKTRVYVKIGTTGTGGMGLNIPYTHGEEKPSRVLLSKSALAGAHSMLLLLFARTPGAPAVKEIKPAAAITWKRISAGEVLYRGKPIPLFDCDAENALQLESGQEFDISGAGQKADGNLESVFIDTGENGLFSLAEFTAITALGQMEAVTPEEIANAVRREIRGETTGHDVVAALDSTVMGPSYRAGVLREHAIREARHLAESKDTPSIAFEILGPPRLSKLLYEAEILRLHYGDLDALAAASPEAITDAMNTQIQSATRIRQSAISVGIPILLRDGKSLLCAERPDAKHRWERFDWSVEAQKIETWCHAEWIDLRPENADRWQTRARSIVAERNEDAATGISSSQLDRRFVDGSFDIGEIAAWIFINEDKGPRIH